MIMALFTTGSGEAPFECWYDERSGAGVVSVSYVEVG